MKNLILLFCAFLFTFSAMAGERAPFGEIKYLLGTIVVGTKTLKGDDKNSEGIKVYEGDTVSTTDKSIVRILLADKSGAIQIGANSSVTLTGTKKGVTDVNLVKGFILSSLRPKENPSDKVRFRVVTKNVAMGVRGTTFFAKEEADGQTFQCICDGQVESTWKKGHQLVLSKNHQVHQMISANEADPTAAPMGSDHTDADMAELKKLF